MATSTETWYMKLTRIDRRLIYVLVTLAIAIPLVRPIMLPLRVSPEVLQLYERIEALKPGDVVVLSFDFSPSSMQDNYPQAEAILNHLALKDGIRVIAVSFWADGPMLADRALAAYQAKGKQYGIDCINLGYCAGGENAIAKFAEDVTSAFPKDFKGMPTDSYPIMTGIKNANDFSLVIDFAAGSPGPREWIRQVQNQYHRDLAIGAGAAMAPTLMPYYNAKQVISILVGLRGAAEYEALTRQPGQGTSGMASETLAHLLIILFLVLSNVGYFMSKNKLRK